MKLEVNAIYNCGHNPRLIIEGEHTNVKKLVKKATKGGLVSFSCHCCKRGAAFIEIRLDGKLVDRNPASDFIEKNGAIVTVLPSQFDEQLSLAELRVADMDRIDKFKERSLPTILAALECGLRHPDTGAQFDAFVMLKDVVDDLRELLP